MPQRLAGKVAIVTGASRGIGQAIAERFAAEGARVVLVARTGSALDAIAAGASARAKPMCGRDSPPAPRWGGWGGRRRSRASRVSWRPTKRRT